MGILTKFKLETDYDALISHYGLDIVEEDDLINIALENGFTEEEFKNASKIILEPYFKKFAKYHR